jgi:hypothetical protein
VTTLLGRELTGLLVASRLWASGRPVDEDRVRRARHAALLANHRRYVATVPVYGRLADELGLTEVADVGTIVDELLVGVSLFKSYDDDLLARGDYGGLTRWVGEVSSLAPSPRLDGVTTVAEWRQRMREDGVFVAVSSGTSGRPSFVPRDEATLAALRANGHAYSPLAWGGYTEGRPDFDCLLVTPPGGARGVQLVATGLVRLAARTVVLEPAEGRGGDAFAAATDLVRAAHRDRRRVLVFGTPPAVAELCASLLGAGLRLALPGDAMLVTGGGWKEQAGDGDLAALVEAALGVAAARTVDVYGMTECNAYLLRCAAGRYHVPPVLEAAVVGEDLRRIPGPDATGSIALLDPFAFSYPGFLLTGDLGRLVDSPCTCGLAGPGFAGRIVRAPGREAKGCAGAAPHVPA